MSITAFIISYMQYKEKGFLFNNAYLYASKKERNEMNKKPHYRQSALWVKRHSFGYRLPLTGIPQSIELE
ncbi:DUF3784 domain-containing protein [Fusibacter sp. Q10-2]|uniref:DUF3784 domain-containing protein n=2 Tax=Fusibacter ferrireducens TaxID=2785058 RepID=A0ABR9ZNM1_9FIRM|nr:DUF3784 domain-containing protein [Fusibacter ferrireducens]